MQVHQIRLERMLVFCYLIEDEASATCALIDPAFDTRRILALVEEKNLRVTHIINTHGHSDHTAGNAYVKKATGAPLLIHRLEAGRLTSLTNKAFSAALGGKGSPRADVLLEDGDVIEIGESKISVIHTPGHTPGGICLYATGHVFTGDTLFVGAVGRTDLPGGSMDQLIESIHRRIYTLPGDTMVWPGHDYGPRFSSTIEQERRTNPYT